MFSSITRFFSDLTTNPAGTIVSFLYLAVCILFSLILHECAHGYAALKCGDPTAKWMGRLTLNPLKHLDPLGTVCMVFLHVGWAKPVPINPRNFKNYRRDYIIVSLAGIALNFCLFLLSLLISALLAKVLWKPEVIQSISGDGMRKALLDLYHYLPANSIYGGEFSEYTEMCRVPWLLYVQRFTLMMAQMNLGLAVFNLLPVPPLDGYRFLDEFAFRGRLSMNQQTMQIIQIVFLVVCVSGVLTGLLTTVNGAVFGWFSGVFALLI